MIYKGSNIKILMKRINEGSTYCCHNFSFVTYIAAVEKEDGLYNFFTNEKIECRTRDKRNNINLEGIELGQEYVIETHYTQFFPNIFYTRSAIIKRLINTNFYFEDLENFKKVNNAKKLVK